MAKPKTGGIKVGSFIAREEAPTMLYRISSKQGADRFQALLYQSRGREVAIVVHSGVVPVIAGDGSVWHKAKTPKATSAAPATLDREIRETIAAGPPSPTLTARAIAAGFEPETEEGGRAMMQSITMDDIRAIKPVTSRLSPGTPVTYTLQYIGGNTQESGVVSWDDGRGNVSIKTKHGGDGIMRAKRNSAGDLIVYG